MSPIQYVADTLIRALHSELAVIGFFASRTESPVYSFTITVKRSQIARVAYVVASHKWLVSPTGKTVQSFETVEDAAAFIRTIDGFKYSAHELRMMNATAPVTTKHRVQARHVGVTPTTGSRWLTREECNDYVLPRLNGWLAVHETKQRETVDA